MMMYPIAYLTWTRYYRGRGAFETMGAGLEMIPGDIAFKVNEKEGNQRMHVINASSLL